MKRSTRSPIPLTRLQVDAATQLHGRLSKWASTDAALEALGTAVPGFDLRACLLKTAAVNQLYGTNVYAITRMAEHIVSVMKAPPPDKELVDRLAALPPATSMERKRLFLSFASKFAHFFIDQEKFPILDSFAVKMVALHLDTYQAKTYSTYLDDWTALRESITPSCESRELDRYLWLAGLYRAWKKNSAINVEVKKLFDSAAASQDLRKDLDGMLGTA